MLSIRFHKAVRHPRPSHAKMDDPISDHHASRVRDSEPPYRRVPRLCGVGVRGLDREARIFGYVTSRRRWSLASISSNCEEDTLLYVRETKCKTTREKLTLVPSGSRIVRQIDLSSRTVMDSSTSLSMTSTVLQLISSRAGKGWYVTFISSFSTPGMSNLAVTCCAQKGGSKSGFDEHVDRCDPHPGTIGGLLELHTTREVVVSYVRAHIYRT